MVLTNMPYQNISRPSDAFERHFFTDEEIAARRRSVLQVRAGLCLHIAELLDSHFFLSQDAKRWGWDVDKAAQLIDSILPDTYDEAAARDAELDEQIAAVAQAPHEGIGDQLREAKA